MLRGQCPCPLTHGSHYHITWLAISFVDQSAVISGLGLFLAHGYSGTSGVRTEELAQSGKALPAFAGNVFLCFRRLAIAAPYQNAFLLIWIWESVESRGAGITVFHWVYKGIQSTMFVLTRDTIVHGVTHAAPMRNVDFPLVLQGFPCRTACAQLGDAAAGLFPQRCHLAISARFPMGFDDFW